MQALGLGDRQAASFRGLPEWRRGNFPRIRKIGVPGFCPFELPASLPAISSLAKCGRGREDIDLS